MNSQSSRNPEGIATLMSEDGLNALLLKPLDAWTAAETMLVWNMALRWVVHYTRSESSVDTRELVRSLRNIADEQDAEGDAFATRAGSVLLREAADALVASETARPDFSLRHLQEHLPWTIPYSDEFEGSAKRNSRRRIGHDVLHVMKSLGRIAAEVERCDHFSNKNPLYGEAFAKEVADLVICALHIAKLEGFDLQDAVVSNSEARNTATIPMEVTTAGERGPV